MPAATKAVAKKGSATTAVVSKGSVGKAETPSAGKAPRTAAGRGGARRKPVLPPEQRRHYVAVAAYFMAERDGFTPGRELEHWAAAETEIDRLVTEGFLNP